MEYDYEPTEEEMEEAGAEEDTAVDFDFKNLQINFDVENFARGIANEVKKTLKTEIISEMKKDVLDGLKDDIRENVAAISEEIVREVYENETIILGGWGQEKQEISIKQYLLNQIRDSFKDGKFITKKKDSWGDVV